MVNRLDWDNVSGRYFLFTYIETNQNGTGKGLALFTLEDKRFRRVYVPGGHDLFREPKEFGERDDLEVFDILDIEGVSRVYRVAPQQRSKLGIPIGKFLIGEDGREIGEYTDIEEDYVNILKEKGIEIKKVRLII